MRRVVRVTAHGVFTLIVGLIFALPGACFLVGHTVTASTGPGASGSWNLELLLLLGGFSGGCALGFLAFRWTVGTHKRQAQGRTGGDEDCPVPSTHEDAR